MDTTPLARALGLPPDLVERAARDLYEERRQQREAARLLQPFMVRAAALYRAKGERLLEVVAEHRADWP